VCVCFSSHHEVVNLSVFLFGIGYCQMTLQTNIVAFKIGWAPGLNVGRESTVVAVDFRGLAKNLQAISGMVERYLPHTSNFFSELHPLSYFARTEGLH